MSASRILFLILSIGVSFQALSATKVPLNRPHLADYDAELRHADGRVDVDAMANRLETLGVTTYYWLVWHAATDWEDLKLFLPRAARAHIQVWVYLVPPSEGPPHYPASEPFGLDYLRWAEEIAHLSVQHTNLTGWVIDDFYANRRLFTPEYVGQMQSKAKAINPLLAFLPLMYFPEITPLFVRPYEPVIDGVVVAYPQDKEEIVDARMILNGQASTRRAQLSCPAATHTMPGDCVSAAVSARVTQSESVHVRFTEQDDFSGKTTGYHFKQFLVGDTVLWEQDVAGAQKGWQEVELDATTAVKGRTKVTVSFRLLDKRGVSNFPVTWRVKDLRVHGLKLSATLAEPENWKVERYGAFDAGFGPALRKGPQRFHIPFVVMTAGSVEEFRLRHGDPPSPERISEWLRMSLQSWREGFCDGVVIYCLDKRPESPEFPLATRLFGEYRKNARP